jgi:hypothetical protein
VAERELYKKLRTGYRTVVGTDGPSTSFAAVDITREGFEWALRNACLSHYVPGVHADRDAWRAQLREVPARVQWDPERDLWLQPLPYRSLQLGLSGVAAGHYADEWIVAITDVTALARRIHALMREDRYEDARRLLPPESVYPVPAGMLDHLGAASDASACH